MNKLKTLKDFEPMNVIGTKEKWISKEDLRQEAVKRAKYFKEKASNDNQPLHSKQYWIGRMFEAMEANNLTEEDLK